MMTIRLAEEGDWDGIWQIFHAVVSKGDTYTFSPDTMQNEARQYWMGPRMRTYVALYENEIVGTYYLKANQPGLGSHVANAGYMVAPNTRSRGIGKAMAEHSLDEARRLGFRAMQYNCVVSTNTNAIALWEKLGFEKAGRLPKAFNHAELGYVDAFVMYREL